MGYPYATLNLVQHCSLNPKTSNKCENLCNISQMWKAVSFSPIILNLCCLRTGLESRGGHWKKVILLCCWKDVWWSISREVWTYPFEKFFILLGGVIIFSMNHLSRVFLNIYPENILKLYKVYNSQILFILMKSLIISLDFRFYIENAA